MNASSFSSDAATFIVAATMTVLLVARQRGICCTGEPLITLGLQMLSALPRLMAWKRHASCARDQVGQEDLVADPSKALPAGQCGQRGVAGGRVRIDRKPGRGPPGGAQRKKNRRFPLKNSGLMRLTAPVSFRTGQHKAPHPIRLLVAAGKQLAPALGIEPKGSP